MTTTDPDSALPAAGAAPTSTGSATATTTTSTAGRRARLAALAVERDLDAVLVSSLVNVRYLTGFTGSNAALLVPADPAGSAVLATDGRYTTQAGQQAPDVELLIERNVGPALARLAGTRGLTRVGFESHIVTVDGLVGLTDAGTAALRGFSPLPAGQAVEGLRLVKDAAEIAALRRACAIADDALAELIAADGIRAGRTEREVGRDLDFRMLSLGADEVSFETIVAAGANSAIPHHRPDDVELVAGDFVKFDFGAAYVGYHSDMTRTFVLGPPADWQREIYDLVADAQRLGREALVIGTEVTAVDAAARDRITAAGYGAEFAHGLGHGVGLEIHEAPAVSALGAGRLAADMVVTVEPGVYLAGRGGVRIEDTLVVRPDGPDLLTLTGKELVVL